MVLVLVWGTALNADARRKCVEAGFDGGQINHDGWLYCFRKGQMWKPE
jgi:hypothetical protein